MDSLSNEKLLTYLIEIETAADQVLSAKQEVVDLDRKRQLNREAIRALDKESSKHWKGDDGRTYLAMGNTFLKLPTRTAKDLLGKGND